MKLKFLVWVNLSILVFWGQAIRITSRVALFAPMFGTKLTLFCIERASFRVAAASPLIAKGLNA